MPRINEYIPHFATLAPLSAYQIARLRSAARKSRLLISFSDEKSGDPILDQMKAEIIEARLRDKK